MKKRYRKAVFIAVYRKIKNKVKEKREYLILRRKLHWKGWEFSKGGIRKKEPVKKAVKRETLEETGQRPIKIKSYLISGKYKYDKIYKDRPGIIGQTWKLYSAEIKNKKIRIDKKEHSSYKWLPYKKTLKLLTWPSQKRCLKIVNKN